MRIVWILLLILCLIATLWLARDLVGYEPPIVEKYPPSPAVRVLLGRKLSSIAVEPEGVGKSGRMSLWLAGADKPLRWEGRSLLIERKSGVFGFAGLKETAAALELIPDEGFFSWQGGRYPGSLRILANGEETFDVVNELPLEPYVSRVVSSEMRSQWPLETLKAQAVAARSFALFHTQQRRNSPYDLLGNSRALSYRGADPARRAIQAVLETRGVVLQYHGRLLPAFFVSTCGGRTDRAALSFSVEDTPCFQGVACPHCRLSPHYEWNATFTPGELKEVLAAWNTGQEAVASLEVAARENERVITLAARFASGRRVELPAVDFRLAANRRAGKEVLRSLHFTLALGPEGLVVQGKGWGWHGSGLCQFGAKKMGDDLRTCKEILEFYFPGAELGRAYGAEM